jgi:hypothetical protein
MHRSISYQEEEVAGSGGKGFDGEGISAIAMRAAKKSRPPEVYSMDLNPTRYFRWIFERTPNRHNVDFQQNAKSAGNA